MNEIPHGFAHGLGRYVSGRFRASISLERGQFRTAPSLRPDGLHAGIANEAVRGYEKVVREISTHAPLFTSFRPFLPSYAIRSIFRNQLKDVHE